VQRLKRGNTEWFNVEHARSLDVQSLVKPFHLSDEDIRLILDASHRSRLFVRPDYLMVFLTHPVYDRVRDDVVIQEIDLLLTPHAIATIHHSPFNQVSSLFSTLQATKSQTALGDPALIFADVLSLLIEDVRDILEILAKQIDVVEEQLFHNRRSLLQELLSIQTNLIDVQKTLESRTTIIDRLLAALPKRTGSARTATYAELHRQTDELQNSLNTEYQTIVTLHRAHETYLNSRTNRLIYILTSVTIIVMPATLLAGIFGMNTVHPWILGTEKDFSIIIAIMVLSGTFLWLFLRRKR